MIMGHVFGILRSKKQAKAEPEQEDLNQISGNTQNEKYKGLRLRNASKKFRINKKSSQSNYSISLYLK